MNPVILLYHYVLPVTDPRRSFIQRIATKYLITPRRLREQLSFVKEHSDDFFIAKARSFPFMSNIQAKTVYVSIDDGTLADFEYSVPLLEEFGITALLFPAAGFVGKDNYMSVAQLRELQARGHLIGSHGFTHTRFDLLSDEQQIIELDSSKKALEDVLNTQVIHFAYPHGAVGTINPLQHGYQYAFTTKPNRLKGHFSRLTIKQDTSIDSLLYGKMGENKHVGR